MTRTEADALVRNARNEAKKLAEGRFVTPINFYYREEGLKFLGPIGIVAITQTVDGDNFNMWL